MTVVTSYLLELQQSSLVPDLEYCQPSPYTTNRYHPRFEGPTREILDDLQDPTIERPLICRFYLVHIVSKTYKEHYENHDWVRAAIYDGVSLLPAIPVEHPLLQASRREGALQARTVRPDNCGATRASQIGT